MPLVAARVGAWLATRKQQQKSSCFVMLRRGRKHDDVVVPPDSGNRWHLGPPRSATATDECIPMNKPLLRDVLEWIGWRIRNTLPFEWRRIVLRVTQRTANTHVCLIVDLEKKCVWKCAFLRGTLRLSQKRVCYEGCTCAVGGEDSIVITVDADEFDCFFCDRDLGGDCTDDFSCNISSAQGTQFSSGGSGQALVASCMTAKQIWVPSGLPGPVLGTEIKLTNWEKKWRNASWWVEDGICMSRESGNLRGQKLRIDDTPQTPVRSKWHQNIPCNIIKWWLTNILKKICEQIQHQTHVAPKTGKTTRQNKTLTKTKNCLTERAHDEVTKC